METLDEYYCDKKECTNPATLVMSFATFDKETNENEWMTMAVCKTHLMSASGVIDMIVQTELGLIDLNGDPSST